MHGRYMGVWTAIGVGAGAAIGSATGKMAVWVALGAAIGIVIGFATDTVRRKKNLSK